MRVTTPIGPREIPSGALVLWRRTGPQIDSAGRRGLTLVYVALDALIVGAFGWYLVSRMVVRPVRRLADATRRETASR